MDQSKIGAFIAEKRKEHGMTQKQLADKLGVTDRAVSKWETGKSLPDASLMLELCDLLTITVNDLLSGETVSVNDYNEVLEENLIDMVRQKDEADKQLLVMEVVIGSISTLFLFTMVFLAAFAQIPNWLRGLLYAIGFAQFLVGTFFAVKIEQIAGYYECAKCGYRYVPKYVSVIMAMHSGRTRFMKCPQCGKRSWQKKVLSKEKTS